MQRKPVALVVLLVLSLSMGCSLRRREAPPEDVDKAAARFFERVKSEQFDSIYDDASDHFKEQNGRLTVVDNLKQVASRGRIGNFRRLSMIFDREGENRIALPVYRVEFDGVVRQMTFKFIDDGGEWKLLGFSLAERGGAPQG